MVTTIDHTVRTKLGIGAIEMMVLDATDRLARYYIITPELLSKQLGLTTKQVNDAIKYLSSLTPSLLTENLDPTATYYDAFITEVAKPLERQESEAVEIVNMFNELTGQKFSLPTNVPMIKKILQHNSKLTKDHFKAVITHKMKVWTKENGMDMYIRPMTLFRSPAKFAAYYEEAYNYYMNQAKATNYARATQADGY